MKRITLLIGCILCYATTFAQNAKQDGDAMAAAGNYSAAALMYIDCMERDEECRIKYLRLLHQEKIEPQFSSEFFDLLSPLAIKGNAEAQYYLGILMTKDNARKDYVQAFEWIKKSAEQGYEDAMNQLGMMYEQGLGTAQNQNEAFRWFRTSAAKGNADAFAWIRKNAEQGNANTQYQLGMMYAQGEGTERSNANALEWIKKSAEQGNEEAYAWIKNNAQKGDLEAIACMRSLAEQGNEEAYAWIKNLAEQGDLEAIAWMRNYAEKGNAEAQYQLGMMYYQGLGLPRSNTEALQWFQKSADNGHEQAKRYLEPLTNLIKQEAQQAASQPRTTQPAASQPRTTQPAATQPRTTQPAATQPRTTQRPARDRDDALTGLGGEKKKGKNLVSIGAGFGGNFYGKHESVKQAPAFFLAYEHRFGILGVGVVGGYTSGSFTDKDDKGSIDYTSTDMMAGVRSTLNFEVAKVLELYIGAMGGYNIGKKDKDINWYDVENTNKAVFSGFGGLRLYLGNSFGLFVEGGYGYSMVSAGFSIRF